MRQLKLTNFIFLQMLKFCVPVLAILVVTEFASLLYVLSKANSISTSLEYVIEKSNISLFFSIAFVLILVAFTAGYLRFFWQSKSIYTINQVEQGKSSLFVSLIVCGILIMLMLWAVQISFLFLTDFLYERAVLTNRSPFSSYLFMKGDFLQNNLFLAFVRVEFLRILFPLSVSELIKMFFVMFTPVLAVLFGICSVLSGNMKRLLFLLPWGYMLWNYASQYRNTGVESEFWSFVGIFISLTTVIYFILASQKTFASKSID